jgi:hypothetical protein
MTRLCLSVLVALALFISAAHAKAALTLSYPTVTQAIPPNTGDLLTVVCPGTSRVVSGGWEMVPSYGPYLMVWVSRQVTANTWRIMTVNKHPTAILAITGYAVCASGVAGLTTYTTSIGPVNVPGFSGISRSVACSSGGIPTGGGFDSNFPDPAQLIPHASYPGPGNVWTSSEYNSTSQTKAFTSFVSCTTNLAGFVTPRSGSTVNFGNGASSVLSVDCNPGDVAIGGGYYTLASGSLSTTLQLVRTISNRPVPTNARRWIVRAYNANAFAQAQVIPYAQCLHLN